MCNVVADTFFRGILYLYVLLILSEVKWVS